MIEKMIEAAAKQFYLIINNDMDKDVDGYKHVAEIVRKEAAEILRAAFKELPKAEWKQLCPGAYEDNSRALYQTLKDWAEK